jgi:mono/diheme cytochrome c family protein
MDFSKVSLVLAAVVFSVACNQPPTSESSAVSTAAAATKPAATPATASAADTARTYFKQKCVVCHGDHGAGDGPGAAALTPKPRAFSLADWQASVTDDQIAKTIVLGGAAVGKDAAMPPNPDLGSKKEVVAELVKIVRGFKK